MKKCYIAGKISNLPEQVYKLNFRRAEIAVSILGYEPVNPVTLNHNHDGTWLSYMRCDLTALLTCDALYAMHGWEDSKGATIEVTLAKSLGIKIIYAKTLGYATADAEV